MDECRVGKHLNGRLEEFRKSVRTYEAKPLLELLYAQLSLDTERVRRLHVERCWPCQSAFDAQESNPALGKKTLENIPNTPVSGLPTNG